MDKIPLRLFFALWPDPATRAGLERAAANLHPIWGGHPVRSESLHLTLAFLGDTSALRLDTLRQLAATLTGEAFTLKLDSPGCWQHNRVGWLGVKNIPPALTHLVANLQRVLRTSDFPLDRQRYIPHVTLLHNAYCSAPPPCQPVVWHAQSFVLLASGKPGGGYNMLGEWPLTAARLAGSGDGESPAT